jgi:hypothetical protein
LGDGRRRAEAIGEMRSISNGHEYKNAVFEIGAGLAAGMCIGDTVGKEIWRNGKELAHRIGTPFYGLINIVHAGSLRNI